MDPFFDSLGSVDYNGRTVPVITPHDRLVTRAVELPLRFDGPYGKGTLETWRVIGANGVVLCTLVGVSDGREWAELIARKATEGMAQIRDRRLLTSEKIRSALGDAGARITDSDASDLRDAGAQIGSARAE